MQEDNTLLFLDDDFTDIKFVENQNLVQWLLRITFGKFKHSDELNQNDTELFVQKHLMEPFTRYMQVVESGRDPPTSRHLHFYFESSKSETTLRNLIREFVAEHKDLELEKLLTEKQEVGKRNAYYALGKSDTELPLKYFNYGYKENKPEFMNFSSSDMKIIEDHVNSQIKEHDEKKKLKKVKGGVMKQMMNEFETDGLQYPSVIDIINWVQAYYDKNEKVIMMTHMVNQAMTIANKHAEGYKKEIGDMILERMSARK